MSSELQNTDQSTIKLPQNSKMIRYYYRHREEILEKIRQKRLENPEYAAKRAEKEAKRQAEAEAKRQAQEQREAAKKLREAARAAKEAATLERRRAKAAAVGVSPSGL
jgi:hypothetical protein